MKILIVGFQRSGTTLLRRILHAHPDVRRMFHEEFLLKKCKSKDALFRYLMNYDIFPNRDNWGEKVPFYPSARGISMKSYCETWNRYFGDDGRILHIVRHPIDIAFSVRNKYGGPFKKAINIYKKIMPAVIQNLSKTPTCFSFKYEDLLLKPEKKAREIFDFCGLPYFDFEQALSKIKNKKYQKIDSSRAFSHMVSSDSLVLNNKIENVVDIINKTVGGTKYEP